MCVFVLQQYEAQLCDPLTLSKTSSGLEDGRLKEETRRDTQLPTGRARAFGMLTIRTHTATDDGARFIRCSSQTWLTVAI